MIIKEFKKLESAPTVILGFPGAGMAGSIATEFIVHKLGFEEIGHIRSEKMPAVTIIRKSRPQSPIRIYHRDGMVVLVSDVMVPDELAHEFAAEIVKWVKSKKAKEVVVIGGSQKKEGEKLYIVSWKDRYLDEDYDKMKLGFVVGIYGPLMMELMEQGIPGYALLAEAGPGPDPKAAAKIVRSIARKYGLKLDPAPLEKEPQKKVSGAKKWDPYPSIYG